MAIIKIGNERVSDSAITNLDEGRVTPTESEFSKVLPSNAVITEVGIYIYDSVGDDTAQDVYFGLYEVTEGASPFNQPLLWSQAVTLPAGTGSEFDGIKTVSLPSIDISAHAGKRVAAAISPGSGTTLFTRTADTQDTASGARRNNQMGPLPNPWDPSFSSANAEPFYIQVEGQTMPTTRKGSTVTVDKPGTLGTITTATLNAVNVFDHLSQTATEVTLTGAATDEITTSGEYALVLGDGTVTETVTVQVNVVGLPIYNLNKDGTDLASLTDVEVLVMTGAAGSRAVSQNTASRTTTAAGDTTAYEVTDLALTVDQNVFVVVSSAASGVGVAFTDTLELI